MRNMTAGQIIEALKDVDPADEVRAVMDEGAEGNCGIGRIEDTADGVLLILNVDEIG